MQKFRMVGFMMLACGLSQAGDEPGKPQLVWRGHYGDESGVDFSQRPLSAPQQRKVKAYLAPRVLDYFSDLDSSDIVGFHGTTVASVRHLVELGAFRHTENPVLRGSFWVVETADPADDPATREVRLKEAYRAAKDWVTLRDASDHKVVVAIKRSALDAYAVKTEGASPEELCPLLLTNASFRTPQGMSYVHVGAFLPVGFSAGPALKRLLAK